MNIKMSSASEPVSDQDELELLKEVLVMMRYNDDTLSDRRLESECLYHR